MYIRSKLRVDLNDKGYGGYSLPLVDVTYTEVKIEPKSGLDS